MAKIVRFLSMSLDGFITGPNDDLDKPLGINGRRLHAWLSDGNVDVRSLASTSSSAREPAVNVVSESFGPSGSRDSSFFAEPGR